MKFTFSIIWLTGIVLVSLISTNFAQSSSENKSRIKNFGSSLKNYSQKNNKKKAEKENAKNVDDAKDVVHIETNLVTYDFLVLDKNFHSIVGLKKEDFVVKENDKSQKTESFSPGDSVTVSRSIVLVIDHNLQQNAYIEKSIDAAKIFVDKLNPNDKMAIVTDDIKLLLSFTQNKELLKKKLDSLKNTTLAGNFGLGLQYDALLATLNEMFTDEDIRPIIIFQTDGMELFLLKQTVSNQHPPVPASIVSMVGKFPIKDLPYREISYEDVYAATEKSRATIYTIVPRYQMIGLPQDEQIARLIKTGEERKTTGYTLSLRKSGGVSMSNSNSLETTLKQWREAPRELLAWQAQVDEMMQLRLLNLAKLSGGWNDFLEKPEQADAVYSRILSGINHRYIISYYSNNEIEDGKERIIRIEIKNHPDYTIWGRTSYFVTNSEN